MLGADAVPAATVMSLRLRLILWVALPATLLVGAHGLLRVWQEEKRAFQEGLRTLESSGSAIRIAIEGAEEEIPVTVDGAGEDQRLAIG